MLYEIDPFRDARWIKFVQSHPHSSIFHSRGWLQALHLTVANATERLELRKPRQARSSGRSRGRRILSPYVAYLPLSCIICILGVSATMPTICIISARHAGASKSAGTTLPTCCLTQWGPRAESDRDRIRYRSKRNPSIKRATAVDGRQACDNICDYRSCLSPPRF